MEKMKLSIEENIILWKKINLKEPDRYFYTDLEKDKLFDGEQFFYATPFSDSCALVNDGTWKIINIDQQEIITIPTELEFEHVNGMRHNNIAVFDKTVNRWGSYHFDAKEKTLEQNIPFIWDALEFSRKKGIVYGGMNKINRLYQADNLDKWWNWQLEVPIIEMPIEKTQTTEYYKKYLEYYKNEFYQVHVRYIREKYDSIYTERQVEERINDNVKNAKRFADFYFEDESRYNHNDEQIRKPKEIKSYQKVMGIIK